MREVSHRWVITFNGEIYNHAELRAELETLGCNLRPGAIPKSSSTQSLGWGEAGLSRLRGMYAFALWSLWPAIAARDRHKAAGW